jgi:diketogulonate reductase-like aldo/keto reductase
MNKTPRVTLHTDREMPVLGLGTWQLKNDTAGTIKTALELGYEMIDTSGDYGTQPGIGKGLKQSGRARESYYLVTKIENYDNAYEATKRNLAELGLEYADMMLIHWPPARGAGVDLWEGLIRAKEEGLTQDIGVSIFHAPLAQLVRARPSHGRGREFEPLRVHHRFDGERGV